jgi:hypothetical protein
MSDAARTGTEELLVDCLTDDVSLGWALIHLGIASNPPPTEGWVPSPAQVDEAFTALGALVDAGLICVGHMERLPGVRNKVRRVPRIKHVPDPLDEVRLTVGRACATSTSWSDWHFACWVVSTPAGDDVARAVLRREDETSGGPR